jgi:hypothetical protein
MAGYELVSIVWHQPSHRIDLNYVHGEPDHMIGSEAITAMLAGTPDSMLCRHPMTPGVRGTWTLAATCKRHRDGIRLSNGA